MARDLQVKEERKRKKDEDQAATKNKGTVKKAKVIIDAKTYN